MNHPTRSEWMGFLYDDVDAEQKANLNAHLKSCEVCQRQVQGWRATMKSLDAWKLPAGAKRAAMPLARWAAAAAVFLAAGAGVGASLRPSAEVAVLRRDLAKVTADAAETRAVLAQITKAMAESRVQDREALVVTLRELETRRLADLQSLRRDLETVAAQTESQFVRLAGYSGSPGDE